MRAFICVIFYIIGVRSYCLGPGKNPSFSAPPKVEQLTPTLVRVSWAQDIVRYRECADNFVVKYWVKNEHYNYKMTKIVDPNVNYVDIKVDPLVTYIYEAIAREDKGIIGVDYNRSPNVDFKTSRRFKKPPPPPPPPELNDLFESKEIPETLESEPIIVKESPEVIEDDANITVLGISIEIFVAIVVAAAVLIIIIVGSIYKIIRSKKGEHDLNPSASGSLEEKTELNPKTGY